MSPTNPFGGFSPQALQLMQQQQRYEAFQRQLQQQLAAQQQHQQQPPAPRGASDLNQQRFPEQAPTPVSTPNVPKEGHSESTPNQPTNNLTQQDPFSNDKQASETILNNDIASPIQVIKSNRVQYIFFQKFGFFGRIFYYCYIFLLFCQHLRNSFSIIRHFFKHFCMPGPSLIEL